MPDAAKKTPRKAAAKKQTAPEAARKTEAPNTSKAPKKIEAPEQAAGHTHHHAPSHEEIAALAHSLWEKRGHHHGDPASDWARAEQQLREAKS